MTLKAYSVHDDENGIVVFAKHRITATRLGANYLDYEGITGLRTRREKSYDQYAETDVPVWDMVGNGWHFECMHCGHRLDSDMEYDRGKCYTKIVGTQRGWAFCDQECHDDFHKRREWESNERLKVIDWAKTELEMCLRTPYIDYCEDSQQHVHFVSVVDNPEAAFEDQTYTETPDQIIVYFRYPGSKHGAASWKRQNVGKDFELLVPKGDHEAFKEWRSKL